MLNRGPNMARPREWDRVELREALLQYIENNDIPILAEFAHTHGVARQYLYDLPELADAVKDCTTKKEAGLERQALKGNVNCSMAIFSLKQLGWTDRIDTTLKGDKAHPLQISSTDAQL
jgi:hypothetical protein